MRTLKGWADNGRSGPTAANLRGRDDRYRIGAPAGAGPPAYAARLLWGRRRMVERRGWMLRDSSMTCSDTSPA